MTKFEELRSKYKSFNYDGYKLTKDNQVLNIEYNFSIDNLDSFKTTWSFPYKNITSQEILDKLVFSLGLVEAISYYKLTCSKEINIKCNKLSSSKEKFFKKLFFNGLGEFMYKNNININQDDLFTFNYDKEEDRILHDLSSYKDVLVPVGGGKDSCVSIELLKNNNITTYSINPNETITNVIKVSDVKNNVTVKRTLDPKILDYNSKGFLNGHTPFSAIVAFSSFITSFLNGFKYIALSNESSANESTVKGSFVNHQYSKSLEFENDFINYIKSICDSDIHYFSFLRPLKEIQIAYLFSKLNKYHSVFRSCNVGSKKGIWCSSCAKCLFVYIVLCPFIKEEDLIKIFGKKVLDNKDLEEDFKGLIGVNDVKPFECVGTRDEVLVALKAYISSNNSYLTDKYKDVISSANSSLDSFLKDFDANNNVPSDIVNLIKEAL